MLGVPKVEYLGHVVDGRGIALSDARKQGIRDLKEPQSVTKLKSFLGLASYFRTFVPDFARIAKPLHAMCSSKVAFRWTEAERTAFNSLKEAMMEAPILHHVDYSRPLVLRTDASTLGIGGVLVQEVDGQELTVCYVSKAFNSTETKWSTIEQEAFAIVYCVLSLQHHLRGHPFVIETDHKNLLFIQKSVTPKIVRWKLLLQEYNFEIRHISGKTNVVADGLSRCLVGVDLPHAEDIRAVHNSVVGHRGVSLTVQLLREGGKEWDGLRGDVERYISSCAVCQKVRLGQGSMAAALATTIVKEPYEEVSIDTIGPLPEDAYGQKYVVVVQDCFTRFVELRAANNASALEAAMILLDVFGRYGCPRILRSDNGPQFTANVIDNFLALLGVGRHLTLPYRPQSNGMIERSNQEVGRHLKSLIMDQRVAETWSAVLPIVQRIMNSTPNRVTGTTPARLMYGGAVSLDRALLKDLADLRPQITVEDYIQTLVETQRQLVVIAAEHQQKVIDDYLAKTPDGPTEFKEGDYVLVTYPDRPPTKLHPKWKGPMIVVGRRDAVYECQDVSTLRVSSFHVSRLKLFNMDQTEVEDVVGIAAVDVAEYVVDSIVDHRQTAAGLQFRVRWKDYGPRDDSWLPYSEVRDVVAFHAYRLEHPELDV